jgi:signal transduction histidine kinase
MHTNRAIEPLQAVLRGLAAGSDPGRLLTAALEGAVASSGATHGLLLGVLDDHRLPLATHGVRIPCLDEAAEAAMSTGRLARRRDRASGATSVAEPLRLGPRIVGALSLAGAVGSLDARTLSAFADAAALALARRPNGPATRAPAGEVLDLTAMVGADPDRATVLVRALDAAERLFGATAGFVVLVDTAGRTVVAHQRGLHPERLRQAVRNPDVRRLLEATELRVNGPEHPLVDGMGRGMEHGLVLPLLTEERTLGHLVIYAPDAPSAADRVLMDGFARHVAMALRSAEVHRRAGEGDERLAAVVHAVATPVVLVDNEGRFKLVNAAAAELLGLTGSFEIGQQAAARLDPALTDLVGGRTDGPVEFTVGRPAQVVAAFGRDLQSSDLRPLGRAIVIDEVGRKREADRLMADFVAVIGHELRTPLTVIRGYVRTLQSRGDDMPVAMRNEALGAVESQADRLQRLIEDLLFVSGIEDADPTVHLETSDLGQVLETFAGERVVIHRPPQPMPLAFDEPKLTQALRHLVDNALKYSEGEVVITALPSASEVEIAVTDTGPGIFSGDIPNLFERFRQLDSSSTRRHGGTGLGLYIARRLVELQGGRIWCESRLGFGSRFAFTVPVSEVATPTPASVDAKPAS